MSYVDRRLHRAYQLPDPVARDVEIHEYACDCGACKPYAPSDTPRLTAADIGKLAVAGALVGNLVAFAIDRHAAAAALLSCFGVGW